MEEFKDLRIVDNFYQTSAFFPMPTTLVGTVSENGQTNLGAYSLCFPYYIAGKNYYAMLLECRNSSNTAQNILRNKTVTLNFIPDERKYFRECVPRQGGQFGGVRAALPQFQRHNEQIRSAFYPQNR